MRCALQLLVVAALVAGCTPGEAASRALAVAEPDVPALPAHDDDPSSSPDARADSALAAREPGALRTVAAAVVSGRAGPDSLPFEVALRTPDMPPGHARRFGTRTLQLQLRTRAPDLTQYPCTSCHAGREIVPGDARIPDAHTSLRVVHPSETGATCVTCHSPDNVELLALRNGEQASLDHVYRVCAQCHVTQADAWAAGAHGKRLDGWQGRRVVMGCADCHDPHAPALEPRTPFRAPRLHRNGSRTP